MSQKHKVVVIGGGFGGLTLVKKLAYEPVDVLLIDRSNHHLFQPLLYQVATGGLSPANIAMPLRTLVRYQSNCKSILGEVASVDVKKQEVVLTDGDRFGFDTLVVAAGAVTSYFNHPEWADNSVGLKSLDDAMKIRGRILRSFERAERSTDVQEQARLLTFVVVGGGPTGVEMAGAIAELAHHSMRNEFRNIKPESARVILVEGQSRPLTMFREDLSAHACKDLERLGVELRMGVQVKAVSADEVELSTGEKLSTNTVIWAAGVSGNPLGAAISQSIGIALERGQRIPVGADCSVSGHPNIFVIGDLAAFTPQGETQTLPGLRVFTQAAAVETSSRARASATRRAARFCTAPSAMEAIHEAALAASFPTRRSAISETNPPRRCSSAIDAGKAIAASMPCRNKARVMDSTASPRSRLSGIDWVIRSASFTSLAATPSMIAGMCGFGPSPL